MCFPVRSWPAFQFFTRLAGLISFLLLLLLASTAPSATLVASDYARAEKLLQTYCSGCHNEADGEFFVGTYEDLMTTQIDSERLVVPGNPEESLLYQLMTGSAQPSMPPSDQPQPSAEDIEQFRIWIASGAEKSSPQTDSPGPVMKRMAPAPASQHLTSSAAVLGDGRIALGKSGHIDILELDSQTLVERIDFPGARITALRLSSCGRFLVIGASQIGVHGEVSLLDLEKSKIVAQFPGHRDAIYAVAISPDGSWIASGGYDRVIRIWDVADQAEVVQLPGHQGPIYDLDFHPSGNLLASSSADQTVKLWRVSNGVLLNTLGQPEGEMRCLRFSPDGKFVFAGGADRQIRSWRVLSKEDTQINPMIEARFAHQSDVSSLVMTPDGNVFSCSVDGAIKAWTLDGLRPLGQLTTLSQAPVALLDGRNGSLIAVGLRGEVRQLSMNVGDTDIQTIEAAASPTSAAREIPIPPPVDRLDQAMSVELPFEASGRISSGVNTGGEPQADLYRFFAVAGETWILEVEAARRKSPLDSKIEILDSQGLPVLKRRLQAVRESYFTFRGKDSTTADDFRMHKWEDMELDEFLYCNSEVTRLWMYPRGPDSGFKVYPGDNPRHTFFGTTAVSHPLGAPAYIVRPLEADEVPLPNGLPIFPLFFENDDDPTRQRGTDSIVTFRAPHSGEYLVRVRDARGFGGEDFHYRLIGRKPIPDFELKLSGLERKIPKGSGREWMVSVKRKDGMNNPIEIQLDNLPSGVVATNPLIIEAGQTTAAGTIYATEAAEELDEPVQVQLTATVLPDSTHETLGGLPLSDYQGIQVGDSQILSEKISIQTHTAKELRVRLVSLEDPQQEISELSIRPGQTISALLTIERNGVDGPISLGRDDAGRNLPHGAFVDNIGLNGLLITENKSEREIFITAAPKVEPGRRQFHFKAEVGDQPSSKPIWLVIEP